ncbi:calcineurin-like phosphoesterase family protein [soil metagenome]
MPSIRFQTIKELCILSLLIASTASAQEPETARGVVFHDHNQNGQRDQGEEGIAGVKISNGQQIVLTDAVGNYEIPVDDDTIIFVIKPRDWMTSVDEDNLPRFYYIHKPAGSPADFRYKGVDPTGPLPESVDFPLARRWEPKQFKALFFGDTQPRNVQEVEYLAHDLIEPLIEENKKIGASFGVTLGDVVFDDLDVFAPLNKAIALLGIPWYNVIGNHDINFDAQDDKHSTETWQRHYGPAYYSFDHGPVHFMVLDDILWYIPEGQDRGRYKGGFGPEQMEFIRNDLAMIPQDQLVVLMMHIPLVNVEDRKELYDLISERPYAMSVSAHTHVQEHIFIDSEDGFQGPEPHHHVVNVTACGSWWRGAPDERGIPHTTMRDGAPNGYSIFSFDGQNYSIEFRAAGRPKEYQMNIYAPEEIESSEAAETEILVNVFAGSEKSVVEMRLGADGEWVPLERISIEDPAYVATKAREDAYLAAMMERAERHREAAGEATNVDEVRGRRRVQELPFIPLPDANKSPHIWRGRLPADPPEGVHLIEVRTTDMFDQTYNDRRSIRVR